MSADDQAFLDVLSSVPNDVKRFSGDIADYVEQHVDRIASSLRETLASSPWIPESARPKAVPKPPVPRKAITVSFYSKVDSWVRKHKLITGTFILGLGVSILLYKKRKSYGKKRRAKRASNGARLEVVVIAGSPHEPVVRSLALDLERRGFIVFVVCSDVDEEILVQNESRSDIRPLMIDVSEPHNASTTIERFACYLQTAQHAFEGARPHHLIFTSLIILPSIAYPSAPIAAQSPTAMSDLLNTRLLHPMLICQSFLPLLTSCPFPHLHQHPHAPPPPPKVLLLTPSIISSLSPPFHAPESVVVAGLTAFAHTLTAELGPVGVPVAQIKLGSFDLSAFYTHARHNVQLQTLQGQRAETLTWPSGTREVYGKNFLSVNGKSSAVRKGSSLRELHIAVFDAMTKTGRTPSSIRVGQGAGTYNFVGNWLPRGLVDWMMGLRKVERHFGNASENGSDASSEGSPVITGESEYVAVYPRSDDGRS